MQTKAVLAPSVQKTISQHVHLSTVAPRSRAYLLSAHGQATVCFMGQESLTICLREQSICQGDNNILSLAQRVQAEKNQGRCVELAHQNSVLKKAVTIQHQRLLKSNAEKDSQLQSLRNVLAQLQDRSQALEAENYALTVHLKQATAGQSVFGGRPPDVF
jgi:hypothetical protein